jgi:mono/diheme cytochrome c family protein
MVSRRKTCAGSLDVSRFTNLLFPVAAAFLFIGCVHAYAAEFSGDDPADVGKILFQSYCISCHGLNAKGDGPAAAALKKKPPDLTHFQQRRNGEFYYVEIARIIDGRTQIDAHGSRTMPTWGKRFSEEIGGQPLTEELISGNLLALVSYLKSIQE